MIKIHPAQFEARTSLVGVIFLFKIPTGLQLLASKKTLKIFTAGTCPHGGERFKIIFLSFHG